MGATTSAIRLLQRLHRHYDHYHHHNFNPHHHHQHPLHAFAIYFFKNSINSRSYLSMFETMKQYYLSDISRLPQTHRALSVSRAALESGHGLKLKLEGGHKRYCAAGWMIYAVKQLRRAENVSRHVWCGSPVALQARLCLCIDASPFTMAHTHSANSRYVSNRAVSRAMA
eukprot:COSAG05_NODE_1331_length_5154_cov_14.769733_4_plen_170_part_00